MTAKLKYAMKLGKVLMPIGTEVEILSPTDPLAQKLVPGIEYKPDSSIVVVKFKGVANATFLHRSQIDT